MCEINIRIMSDTWIWLLDHKYIPSIENRIQVFLRIKSNL